MKEKWKTVFDKWQRIYYEENDRLGGNSKEGDFIEGWCIIENDIFVKSLEDAAGLLIFGYDTNVFDTLQEWIKMDGEDGTYFGYPLKEIVKEVQKYFEFSNKRTEQLSEKETEEPLME